MCTGVFLPFAETISHSKEGADRNCSVQTRVSFKGLIGKGKLNIQQHIFMLVKRLVQLVLMTQD